jgi:ornithine carbamoyltransferase
MNLLTIGQLDQNQIEEILTLSIFAENNKSLSYKPLEGKNILFAFEKPSLRTKLATEVAINQLGGNVLHITPENFFEGQVLFSKKSKHSLKGREALKDTVKNVVQWCDVIFARVFSHETLLQISDFAQESLSVVNALCDKHHPLQAFADILTIKEVFADKKVKIAFIGDANNVAFSLFEILLKLGYKASFAGPANYSFSLEVQNYLKTLGEIEFFEDPKLAIKNADIVYSDTFISMGEEAKFSEKLEHFEGYQVDANLLGNAYFMHCLPAHRGIEVTDEVIDSEKSLVYLQAKNRMVSAKGVFIYLTTK